MSHRSAASLLLCAALLQSISAQDSQANGLNEPEFERLHELLQPSTSEAWRSIPWKIALLDGQRVAAADKKPIFIWAMDGHPLGCT